MIVLLSVQQQVDQCRHQCLLQHESKLKDVEYNIDLFRFNLDLGPSVLKVNGTVS